MSDRLPREVINVTAEFWVPIVTAFVLIAGGSWGVNKKEVKGIGNVIAAVAMTAGLTLLIVTLIPADFQWAWVLPFLMILVIAVGGGLIARSGGGWFKLAGGIIVVLGTYGCFNTLPGSVQDTIVEGGTKALSALGDGVAAFTESVQEAE